MPTPDLGQRISSGLGQIPNALFPMDPQATQSMDPQYVQQMRNNAMLQMGLGMVSAGRAPGGTLGGALNAGLGQASTNLQGAMQNSYMNAMRNRAQTRQEKQVDIENQRADQAQQHQQWLEGHSLEREKTSDQRWQAEQDSTRAWRESQSKLDQERLDLATKAQEQRGLGAPPAGYRYKADGSMEFIPGGPADPSVATSNRTLRPIPASAAKGIIENRSSLKQIDRALKAVDDNPDAFGAQNYMPDVMTQRLPGKGFSGGLDARAQVADIGSLKLHDRSGAAVTAAEFPRLKPFIPVATDDHATVKTKLANLKANLETMQDEIEGFYTPEAGYRPLQGGDAAKPDPLGIR